MHNEHFACTRSQLFRHMQCNITERIIIEKLGGIGGRFERVYIRVASISLQRGEANVKRYGTMCLVLFYIHIRAICKSICTGCFTCQYWKTGETATKYAYQTHLILERIGRRYCNTHQVSCSSLSHSALVSICTGYIRPVQRDGI